MMISIHVFAAIFWSFRQQNWIVVIVVETDSKGSKVYANKVIRGKWSFASVAPENVLGICDFLSTLAKK